MFKQGCREEVAAECRGRAWLASDGGASVWPTDQKTRTSCAASPTVSSCLSALSSCRCRRAASTRSRAALTAAWPPSSRRLIACRVGTAGVSCQQPSSVA
jgi:hypothetical protein